MRSRVMRWVVSVCVYVYMWPKNWLFEVLLLEKPLVDAIFCSLIEFNHQKKEPCYARCDLFRERHLEAFY